MRFEVVEELNVDMQAGIIADYSILFTNPNGINDYLD
jgi:hypothetical protein